jgi:hypothetical protein
MGRFELTVPSRPLTIGIVKNSGPTTQRENIVSALKINRIKLFREIIPLDVCFENHEKTHECTPLAK